jgi:glycine/D-amino acid oxidase-like deaminating enzyme
MKKKIRTRHPSAGARMDRRNFIKQAGSGVVAAAAVTAVPVAQTVSLQAQGAGTVGGTYDWVVVGAGDAGCTAAIFGADKGMKTLLLEKENMIGGTTALSGGHMWCPNNSYMKAAGFKDSREEALTYLRFVAGGLNVKEDAETFVDNAPRAIEYLRQNAEVRFRLSGCPDFFYPEAPTAKEHGRPLICEPFPAETLGKWRDKVQYDIYYHHLFAALNLEHNPGLDPGMPDEKGREAENGHIGPQIGYSGPIRGRDTVALRLWKARLGAKLEPLLKADEELRVAGAALVAYLFRAIIKRGIEVRTGTRVERLLLENGRVVGVVVDQNGKKETIRATKGVMLATGGGNAGRMAAMVGAATTGGGTLGGGNSGIIRVPDEMNPNGTPIASSGIRGNYEQRMRHSLIVNRAGERFGDEGRHQGLTDALKQTNSFDQYRWVHAPNYFIFDQNLIDKYSFVGRPPGATEELEWLAQGKTIAGVAEKLKLPATTLEKTVARFNEFARAGKDLDFRRFPNTMAPLEKPPFYGVEMGSDPTRGLRQRGATEATVVFDTHGQALEAETNKPFPGLYVGGAASTANQIWGVNYQIGLFLMQGITYGMLAAEHAALNS